MQKPFLPPPSSIKRQKSRHHDRNKSGTPFLMVDETGYISENPYKSRNQTSYYDNVEGTDFSSYEESEQQSFTTNVSASLSSEDSEHFDRSITDTRKCTSEETVDTRKCFQSKDRSQKTRKVPFSKQTPRLSNETPIILATARQSGSTIQTSCNRESIKLIATNGYRNTNLSSSAYFTSSRTTSSLTGSSSHTSRNGNQSKLSENGKDQEVRGHAGSRSNDDMVASDISHVRHSERNEDEEASMESQIYMSAVWQQGKLGIAYYDVETTCVHAMLDKQENENFGLLAQVYRQINPVQIILSSKQDERLIQAVKSLVCDTDEILNDGQYGSLQFLPSIDFGVEMCKRRIISMDLASIPAHFTDTERTLYMSSFVPFENICMVRAIGGLLKFLEKMRIGIELEEAGTKLPVLDVKIFTLEGQMILDDTAYSALQIFYRESHPSVYKTGTSNSGKEGLSLFGIMNRTRSKLGSQMLRTWFQRPLKSLSLIRSRHEAVEYFTNPRNMELVTTLEDSLKNVKNITRILGRMKQSHVSIGDWQALYKTVYSASCIKEICCLQPQSINIFKKVTEKFTDDLTRVSNLIGRIVDFPESSQQRRFVVKPNVDEHLDEVKRTFEGLPDFLSNVAEEELKKLGDEVSECIVIYMPQVGYLLAIPEMALSNFSENTDEYQIEGLEFVFGSNFTLHYRSEGTKDLLFVRSITPKVFEVSISNFIGGEIWLRRSAIYRNDNSIDALLGDTRSEITDMETTIMHKLQDSILEHTDLLLQVIDISAELDCLLSLAVCAREYGYMKPIMTEENIIEVHGGRHPIQEMCCGTFVPNDIMSDNNSGRIKVLTGPNACGKSVYLKQVALIVFMAQIGSFVPAESAKLGLFDRIFTRVSSLESVSVGLSTFMIDINQMSDALRNAGKHSLCVIDEFGKGTDMIDGVSLLVSCLKYWINKVDSPHVFVCTHFHSIIHQHLLPRTPLIKYMTLETLHNGAELVFLYQLVEGHTSSSYACHVAAQAGLPQEIVKRGTETSELIRQCKPIQRVDSVSSDTQYKRCSVIVKKFLELDLDTADVRKFLTEVVLPTMDGTRSLP